MAIASNAQREPSMEEILASIRRIIEDSDGGRRPTADDSGVTAGQADVASATPEVEEFRAELRDQPSSPKQNPVSLAEVQAQLASADAPANPNLPLAREDSSEELPPARPVTLAEVGARIAAEQVGKEEDVDGVPDAGAQARIVSLRNDELKPGIAAQEFEEAGHQSAYNAGAQHAESSVPASKTEPAVARPPLVSEETSRQVAAAFGELSETFASRSRKSFDEMAEEMLRPMLQEWLDNNLPTLVERLVREEIERVARGGAG